MTQLRIPTLDFDAAPSVEEIEEGVAFIKSFKEKNESVYIHCKAGRGRSALLVVCYLIKVINFIVVFRHVSMQLQGVTHILTSSSVPLFHTISSFFITIFIANISFNTSQCSHFLCASSCCHDHTVFFDFEGPPMATMMIVLPCTSWHCMVQHRVASYEIHELYPTNHHSYQGHAIYGTSCLLLAFPNPTTCHV